MPRATPTDRLHKLLDAAARAFIEHGFQRTQMDDIAERLGVSKGTIYRAVDSKEALFAAVVEWADCPNDLADAGLTTVSDLAGVASRTQAELAAAVGVLELTTIVGAGRGISRSDTFGDEVARVTGELFGVMRTRRTTVMVLDRCAAEIPELAAVWFGDARYALVDLWVEYLRLRASVMSSDVDVEVLARTIIELVTLWAVKMPWDPAPRPYPDDIAAACAAMVRHLVSGAQQ